MARRRIIDPSIWTDEGFGKLSDKAKILFIGCFSTADDDGRLSANLQNIKADIFRFEDIKLEEIELLLQEISTKLKNFTLYEIDSVKYIQLNKWEEYQKQRDDRRKKSKIPKCPHSVNQISAECPPKLSKVKLSKDNIEVSSETSNKPDEPKKKELLDSTNPIHRIMGYFNKKFKDRFHFEYPMSFGKDGNLIKNLYHSYVHSQKHKTEDFILNLIDIYFDNIINQEKNKNLINSGEYKVDIGIFITQITKCIAVHNQKLQNKKGE